MEHLPVNLKKGSSFLKDISSNRSSFRALCSRGKLLCFLDQHSHLKIHCLCADEMSVSIDVTTFTSCQWVVPSISTQDCVLDQSSQQKSEIMAMSSTFDLYWYSVCEGREESDDIIINKLAMMTKRDLCTELRNLDHSDVVHSLGILGSHENQVLLLINSAVLCTVTFDPEYGRVAVQKYFPIESTLDPYVDDTLPNETEPTANFAFRSPLLYALTRDGFVFVYNVVSCNCIGIVNTKGYCQYMSSRQPDSENLLSSVSSGIFVHLAIFCDHTHLAAITSENHIILVNLADYFQIFPSHYNLHFVQSFMKKHRGYSLTPLHPSTIVNEEEYERTKYGGLSSNILKYGEVRMYPGQYGHSNRLKQLNQCVSKFTPSTGSSLNFHQVSNLPSLSAYETKRNELLKIPGIKKAISSVEHVSPSLPSRESWYEKPQSQIATPTNLSMFNVPFVTALTKMSAAGSQQSSMASIAEAPLASSNYLYTNCCILPGIETADTSLVRVGFSSGMVIGYYGYTNLEGESEDLSKGSGARVFVSMLVTYHTETQSYSFSSLSQPCWLIESNSPDQLLYIGNENILAVTTFKLSQEDFISKVLMYGSASVAEELCHLNRWDKCSLPVNALEMALELRQLDTLAFFLRNRDSSTESVDSVEGKRTLENGDSAYNSSLPPLPPEQLDTVVQLLIGAIRRNYVEENYCQFASQLLLMTLGFLTRIIKSQVLLEDQSEANATGEATREESSNEDSPGLGTGLPNLGLTVSLADLSGYIEQLRNFLPKSADSEKFSADNEFGDERSLGSLMFVDPSLVREWDKLTTKEVIKDALLKSCLPSAQTYLVHNRTVDSDRARKGNQRFKSSDYRFSLSDSVDTSSSLDHESNGYNASLRNLLTIGTGFIIEALERKDLRMATSLLVQMGQDVQSCLKHICIHTLDRGLRDFLVKELAGHQWLQPPEEEALQYLLTLEKFYPVQSYDTAHSLYTRQHPRKMTFQSTALPVMPGIVSRPTAIPTVGDLLDIYPETFGGDYALKHGSTHFSNDPSLVATFSDGPYLQVSLATVLTWDEATRQRVLFEGLSLCNQSDGEECEKLVKKDIVFSYHARHCDLKNVLQFVMSRIPPLENHTHPSSDIISLCSGMPHAMQYMRTSLYNELARHGIFLPEELDQFPRLLQRLGQAHSLFTHPHPLTKAADRCLDDTDDDGEPGGCCLVVSLESFHRGFLKYLMDNKFYSLFYHYLDYYNLALDEGSISMLGLHQTGQPWVDVLLQYRYAAIDPHRGTVMFQASIACGNLLLSRGTNSCTSVMGMLQNGRTLMAIATLMFAPVPLEEAMSITNSHQPWYVDPVTLRLAVSAYPSLQAALFPPPPTSITPAQSQDTSVYLLLQGTVPFNISRLFKWQSTNTLAQDEVARDVEEMPHFSAPTLTDKFAYTEHLNYIYYLRRGQPSFAFANFVAAKLIGHSHTAKRIDKAISRVYCLAMMDFSNSRLVSSCVAFIEMVEKDSSLLRVDSQSALRMAHYWGQPADDTIDGPRDGKEMESGRHKKLAMQYLQLHQSPDNSDIATDLLSRLETSTHKMVVSSGVELCGLESEECYSLVQTFCTCHNLLPSVAFLTVCCKEGQWLPMLCQAQLYNINPQKVLMIVDKNFSDPSLHEHLQLAVSAMVTKGTSPTSPTRTGSIHDRAKSKRKRIGSVGKAKAGQRAGSIVSAQPDLRAKFYSRVGLQRDVTPQPNPKAAEEETPIQLQEKEGDSDPVKPTSPEPLSEMNEILLPIEEADLPEDLFSALLKCQSYKLPWRALLAHAISMERPLLAILAACYEDSAMVDCMCVWLFSTLGSKVMEIATSLLAISKEDDDNEQPIRYSAYLQWRRWTPHDLSVLIVSALQHTPNPVSSFTLGFKYFDKNRSNPVFSFMKFQEEFVLRSNYTECWKYLQEFNNARDSILMHDFELSIGDLPWVEQLVATIASHMLVKCPTPFERSHLLRLFSEAQFGQDFKCSVLNYNELHQMTKVLGEAGLASDAAFIIKDRLSTCLGYKSIQEIYSVSVRVNADFVLNLLLEREQFDIARKYASIVHSTASQVTVKEAEHNLHKLSQSSTSYFKYEQARVNFWYQCHSNFQAANVEPELAADFFESIVHRGGVAGSSLDADSPSSSPSVTTPTSQTAMERAMLLAFALKWRKESKTPLSNEQIKEFERDIWLSHIHSTMESMENPTSQQDNSSPLPFFPEVKQSSPTLLPLYSGHTSLLSSLYITSQEFKGCPQLTEFLLPESVSVALEGRNRKSLSNKEGVALNLMLGRLMNAGYISQARELAALFSHDSPDLTVTLCCIQLAQGSLTPAQLTDDVLSLVATRSPAPRHLSDPTLSLQDSLNNRPSMEIMKMMNQLSDRALYAQASCSIIRVFFTLALVLRIPYSAIVTTDPFETLSLLLSSKHLDKIRLAARFVTVCNLDTKRVAGFLSNCVAGSLNHHASAGNSQESTQSSIYHPQMTSRDFVDQLAQLCKDQSLLGNNLLSMAKASISVEAQKLFIPVELLIRSHDCFSIGCCVHGVADVLVTSRQLVDRLMAERKFKLMVRLLTGLSRYNEMSYIFSLLITEDFESLIHTGVEKEEQLRIALLDYLTTHGNDPDKIQMVTLKFKMFRELAKVKEEQAINELKSIKTKQLGPNHPETIKRLKMAFENFTASSKTYSQEDCLTRAESAYSQARLVALQLSVLQQGKQVINLDARGILKYMEEEPFSEALIVSAAYRHCRTDWINPLYKRVILRGDFKYLNDFKSAFPLSPPLIQELCNKYLRDKEKTLETAGNIKKLLGHLKNLPMKKKLAIQLGLKDVIQSLSASYDFEDSFLMDVSRL